MTVVLVHRDGKRALVEVAKPEMCIRLQSRLANQDFDLHTIDIAQRLVYVERK